jgi:hypothetical protein
MRILFLIAAAVLTNFAMPIWASAQESCAYSLVRFNSNQGERVAMIPRLELLPSDLAAEPIVDITALIESEGKILPAQAIENAFLDSDRQRFLAEKACELGRNRINFLTNYSALLVRVQSNQAVLPLRQSRVLVGGAAPRVLAGTRVLMRESTQAGLVLTLDNLATYVAGLVIENRFVPIEFLQSPLNRAYLADIVAIVEGARANRQVERGDLVEKQ